MTHFRTILFDLDGTLIDHFAAIHRTYAHTLPQIGLPAPSLEQVRAVVGGGLDNAMRRLVGPELAEEGLRIYRAYWPTHMLNGVTAMPGAIELLRALHARGVICAVFTNKLGSSSRVVCDYLHLTPFLRLILGATDTPWLKPQPEFTRLALRLLAARPETTLIVGDSPYDVKAAHNIGIASWVVTTGTHTAPQLRAAGADRIFPNFREMAVALGVR